MEQNKENSFIGYEYQQINVPSEQSSMYMDCYEAFGWEIEETNAPARESRTTAIRMKRNRKIMNKMELTRLQRHFEACCKEVETLEKKKNAMANCVAFTVAFLGTVFMAGATFAAVHEPPIIWLCVLLAIPGFTGWILPYFIHSKIAEKKAQEIQPLIEAKQDEIYEICKKGHSLL